MAIQTEQRRRPQLARAKYTRRQHPLSRRQVRMFAERAAAKQMLSPQQVRQKQLENQKIISDIRREKNPDKLNEKLKQAEKMGLTASLQKDSERLKKMQKAQERMVQAVKRLSDKASHSNKVAVDEIKSGRGASGLHEMKQTGRDGAVGNEIADASAEFAAGAEVISGLTGRHADSVMYNILRDHSRPADAIHHQKDKEGKDLNAEGRRTKDSTEKQMMAKRLRDRRGRA